MKKLTIYICNDNKKGVIEPMLDLASSYKTNIEIIGSGGQNENSLKEIVLSKVDVAITGLLSSKDCETLSQMSPNTKILMLTNDENRAKSIIGDMSRKNIYNVAFLDLTQISPKEVFEFTLDNFPVVDDSPDAIDDLKTVSIESLDKSDDEDTIKVETVEDVQKKSDDSDKDRLDEKREMAIQDKNTLLNLKSKTVSFFSKKGGTGKTTIACELAHLYGNVVLPNKLEYDSKYLKTCLLDLDFEQGNVRSRLGIENPLPNNYMWIEDIVNRIDRGEDIDRIRYTNAQVMSQFTKKINGEFYVAINDQGGIPYRIIDKINKFDTDGKLFQKIITIIINSLKNAFDIVIIDLPSEFKEECLVATALTDLLIYPICPTIMDLENFKVFLDEVKEYDVLDYSKIALCNNKEVKSGKIMELFDMIHKEIKYKTFSYDLNKEVSLNVPIVAHIPYSTEALLSETSYSFTCDNGNSLFKKELLRLAEFILPIFKIKTNRQAEQVKKGLHNSTVLSALGLKDASKKAKEEEDKKSAEEERLKREAHERKHNKHKEIKPEIKAKTKKENEPINGEKSEQIDKPMIEPLVTTPETKIDDSDSATIKTVEQSSTKETISSTTVVKKEPKKSKGLFSKKHKETLEEFVARLIELSKDPKNRIRIDEDGFPHCIAKPKKTSGKVWNEYRSKLLEVNKANKAKRNENQN